jgi:hypothetical protein
VKIEQGFTRQPALTVADIQAIAKWCFDNDVPLDTEVRGKQSMAGRIYLVTIRKEEE